MTKTTQVTIIHPSYPDFQSHMDKLFAGMLEIVSLAEVLRISTHSLAPRFAEGSFLFHAKAELTAEWEVDPKWVEVTR